MTDSHTWADPVTQDLPAAPTWTRDLVIYELNPYAFTSPRGAGDGSGSGTFDSLRERLPYLEDLGVTGIWLAGYCTCTSHFYNIKTVYACVRPDVLDPALGNRESFRSLIAEAHRRGLRVFLDVITHGVINDSPLIAEHPEWFASGSWGMTDYNYDNREFRAWWVDLWTSYVLEDGVDGFRLDVPRQAQMGLWADIAARCAVGGHPIAIFPEHTCVFHFGQHDVYGFSSDLAGEFASTPQFVGVQISCHDAGWQSGPGNYYNVKRHRGHFSYTLFGYNIPIFMSGEEFHADPIGLPNLEKELFGGGGPGGWLYGAWIQWDQIERSPHKEMLDDTRRMLKIRREHRDLLHADRTDTHIIRLPHTPATRPIPYARFLPGRKAIIVAASHDDFMASPMRLAIPLAEMGLAGRGAYRVTDLWSDDVGVRSEAELHQFDVVVPRARAPGGGCRVFLIEPKGSA